MQRISNQEVQTLANYSLELQADYSDVEENDWSESPFGWIRTRSSRQRGAIAERLLSGYLALKGFDVTRSPDSDADRIVGGQRVEIKMSTLWKGGRYRFQQLRDQDYSFVLCLGISPFDAHLWALPKALILEAWSNRYEGMGSQHGGRSGSDTAWLSVTPTAVPAWLRDHGGDLTQALRVVAQLTGQDPAA